MFPRELLDCRLQSLSRTSNFAARKFSSGNVVYYSTMPTHAEKNRERRVLFPLKRANIAAFCLYDRAAGPGRASSKPKPGAACSSSRERPAGRWLGALSGPPGSVLSGRLRFAPRAGRKFFESINVQP
jgi:hypothetical protein